MPLHILSSIYLTKTNTTGKTNHRCFQPSDISNLSAEFLICISIRLQIYLQTGMYTGSVRNNKVVEMASLCIVKINSLIKYCHQFFLIKCKFIHHVAYYYFYQEITCTVAKSVKSKFLIALVLYHKLFSLCLIIIYY